MFAIQNNDVRRAIIHNLRKLFCHSTCMIRLAYISNISGISNAFHFGICETFTVPSCNNNSFLNPLALCYTKQRG